MIFWHYTTGANFIKIVEDGFILPATARIDPGERPIVWFSANQHWEHTASKALMENGKLRRLTMHETSEGGGGLVRFGVSIGTATHNWKQIRELSGMSSSTANHLVKEAARQGASPHEWRGAFEAVPRHDWLAIGVFQDGAWVSVPIPEDAP